MRKSVVGTVKYDYQIIDKINETKKRSRYLVKCKVCGHVKKIYNLCKEQLSHSVSSCKKTYIKSVIGNQHNDFMISDSYMYNGRHHVNAKCMICNSNKKQIAYKDFINHKNLHSKHCTVYNTKKYDKKLLRKLHRTYQGAKNRCLNTKTNPTYNNKCFEFDDSVEFIKFMYNPLVNFIKNNPKLRMNDITIDRINNNKGYSKDNIRWLSRIDNLKNR